MPSGSVRETVRVLLVEDDLVDAQLALRELGHPMSERFDVTHVTRLDEAVAHLTGGGADVVLLDLSLPDADGVGSIEKVQEASPETPIVIWIGRDQTALADVLLESGVQDCISKGNAGDDVLKRSLCYAIERQKLLQELGQERRELAEFVEAIRSGQVDAILSNGGRSEVLRLLDAKVVEENERLIRELSRTNAELALSNKYKSEFLSNMSHELRTPLNSMLILSNSLAKNEDGNLTESQVEAAKIVHSGGNELLALINEILDLSKIEAGRMDVLVESLDVGTTVESLTKQFAPLAEDRSIRFTATVADATPEEIETDGQRLRQILKNLLSNAIKFTGKGEVTLHVSRAAHAARPPALAGAKEVVAFSVIDTGIGIPAERRSAIFEAFQQVDGSTSRSYGGTGLGLTISRELAALLGGELRLESSSESGSTFTLYLPSNAPTPKRSHVPCPGSGTVAAEHRETIRSLHDPSSVLGGRKVLLVDDDARNLFALSKVLSDVDLVVEAATNGKMAIEKLEAMNDFDLILMDVMMPVMDGFEAIRRIRGGAKFQDLPIIALTAKAMPKDREECMAAGASDYMSKPVDTDHLIALLRRWLPRLAKSR